MPSSFRSTRYIEDSDEFLVFMAAAVVTLAVIEHERNIRARSVKDLAAIAVALLAVAGELDDEDNVPASKRPRLVYDRPDYNQSPWGRLLRDERLRQPSSREARVFRRNFRLPYVVFIELVTTVKELGWFPVRARDVAGRPCVPLELKVLGVLQILGRGNCYRDVCQMSYMSESLVCRTLHAFCRLFAEELYENYIRLPEGDEHERVMEGFHRVGLTGAVGSTHVIHIRWDCSPRLRQRSCTGDEGFTRIAYQATVDHTGRVLGVSRGIAGAQDDKAIVRLDRTVEQVRDNPRYKHKGFNLWREDGSLAMVKGNYLVVDTGSHKWRGLLEPTKLPLTAEDTCFSKWLDSVRKDSACFFGRLKGRFRLLKLPIVMHTPQDVDNAFVTCCILHNMLHEFDGLRELEAGVHWDGRDGLHSAWVADPLKDVTSVGLRKGGDKEEPTEVEESYDSFRNMVLESFTYRRTQNDIGGSSTTPRATS